MTHLNKLKTSNRSPTTASETTEQRLQRKLTERLKEQKEIAEADLKGEQLVKTWTKYVPDPETGEKKRVEQPRRLRRWWWQEPDGAVLLRVRYGNKVLSLDKDKSTIEVGKLDKLPAVIDTLVAATQAGELDGQLKAAMGERRTRRSKA